MMRVAGLQRSDEKEAKLEAQKNQGTCPMGYQYVPAKKGGYVCTGGNHTKRS